MTRPLLPRSLLAPTALDRRLFAQAALVTALLLALAALVAAATDEPTLGWAARAARLSALAPALGALAVALVADRMRRRDELAALAFAGASPTRSLAGASLGASLVGVAASLALAASSAPLDALFPALAPSPWRVARDAPPRATEHGSSFVAPAHGLVVEIDHPPSSRSDLAPRATSHDTVGPWRVRFVEPVPSSPPQPPRLVVALAVALASVVAPAWAAAPIGRRARSVVAALVVALAVVAFHAVAVGAPAVSLLAPTALLAAHLALALVGQVVAASRLRHPAPAALPCPAWHAA